MSAPRVTYRDPHIVQLFNLFADYIDQIAGAAGGQILTTNVIRVDKGGSDVTGTRNDFNKPFLTIQAAVNAAQDKDLILVGPGTYNEQVTVPPTIGVSILGAGIQETILTFAGQALIWNPSVDTNFIVSGMSFPTGGVAVAPTINSLGVVGLIAFNNLLLAPAPAFGIELTRVNVALVTDCIGDALGNSAVVIRNCANIQILDGLNFGVSSVYDLLNPVPALGNRSVDISGCTLVNVVNAQLSEMNVRHSTILLGVAAILTDDVTAVNGEFTASDSELGDVSITATFLTVATPVNAGDINRCGMRNLTTDATASTISRVRVRVRNCVIDPTISINAGDKIDLDLRCSHFPQAALAVAVSGRINRSMYRFIPVVAPNPPGLIPLGPAVVPIPIPYMDVDYTVVFEFSSPGGDAYVVNPSKTVGAFTAGTSIPGGTAAEIMILQQ